MLGIRDSLIQVSVAAPDKPDAAISITPCHVSADVLTLVWLVDFGIEAHISFLDDIRQAVAVKVA